MGRFEKMPTDAFKKMTYGAGVVASKFEPETGVLALSDILFATKGGNAVTATREIVDQGADLDNCPENVYQLQKAQPFQTSVSGTAVSVDEKIIKKMFANADVTTDTITKISLRDNFKLEDFEDIWLIVNYSSDNTEETGGFIAYHFKNTINVDGFSSTFAKNANGEFPYNFKAFYDLNNLSEVPFEIYIKSGEKADETSPEITPTETTTENTEE